MDAKPLVHPQPGLLLHRRSRASESGDVQEDDGVAGARGGADRGPGGDMLGCSDGRSAHRHAADPAFAGGAGHEEESRQRAGGGKPRRRHPVG